MTYKIDVHNFVKDEWEEYGTAETIEKALDVAEKAVGFHKDYDDVSICDKDDVVVWDIHGFRQGEGLKLPLWSEIEKKEVRP